MIKIRTKKSLKEWLLLFVFYLYLFQNPLSNTYSLFAYIDEIIPLLGFAYYVVRVLLNGKLQIKKSAAVIALLLILYTTVGFWANLKYHYQIASSVLLDFYTNIKFFLSIVAGFVLFMLCDDERSKDTLLTHAKAMAFVFFVLLCMDLAFHMFPSPQKRYGLRVVQLFFGHATYLAGAMVFLLSIMLAFYEEKNNLFICFALAVLCFTFRGKALAGAACYVVVLRYFVLKRKKIRLQHILAMGVAAFYIGKEQLSYYYVELGGKSARSILTETAFKIMRDYFPIGTGFGTYASAEAGKNYSPVYDMYGFRFVHELDGVGTDFFSDTFWPIIMGQTGAVGVVCFVAIIALLFVGVIKVKQYDIRAYAMGIFVFAYVMISSTSEPAFHNSVTIPLAMMLGYIFTLEKQHGKKT